MIRDCIKRAVEEITALDKSFENFKFECMYDLHKRGKPLVGLKFSWKAEERKNEEKKEEKSANNINKASKNKFNNLESRKYNYEELERALLRH